MERFTPLYRLPDREVPVEGGDTVILRRLRHRMEIRLACARPATGPKLLAIQELQAAAAIHAGSLKPAAWEPWHRYYDFRILDRHLPELHQAIVGIASGDYRLAGNYITATDRRIAEVMEELRVA